MRFTSVTEAGLEGTFTCKQAKYDNNKVIDLSGSFSGLAPA
jgi:hypothetical protein